MAPAPRCWRLQKELRRWKGDGRGSAKRGASCMGYPPRHAGNRCSAGMETGYQTDRVTQMDDLTRIKGIGPSRQKWFRDALGVTSFGQLAQLSPEVIETALREEGRIVSRSAIEEWIMEADRFASGERGVATWSGGPFRNDGWRPFASFVVEFQERKVDDHVEQRTLVHHMESAEEQTLIHEMDEGAKAKTWPGLESRQLCSWMIRRLDTGKRRKEAVARTVEPGAAGAPPAAAQIEMKLLRIYQPVDTTTPLLIGSAERNVPVSGVLKGSEPFAVEAVFGMEEGSATATGIRSGSCVTTFYLRNIATGSRQQLGEPCRKSPLPGENSCLVELGAPAIPPGPYQLTAVVILQGGGCGLGSMDSSPLQVV